LSPPSALSAFVCGLDTGKKGAELGSFVGTPQDNLDLRKWRFEEAQPA
jgi:hypothetical protein